MLQKLSSALHSMIPTSFADIKRRIVQWYYTRSWTWLISSIVHCVLLLIVALIPGRALLTGQSNRVIEAIEPVEAPKPVSRFELGDAPLDPSELSPDTLDDWKAEPIAQTAQYNDDSEVFIESGGGTHSDTSTGSGLGFNLRTDADGPALNGGGGIEGGSGLGSEAGAGGAGSGFGQRGAGHREAMPGVTKASERAVAAALNWLARHQNSDGSWSLDFGKGKRCSGASCSGPGTMDEFAAATALGILPFLGSGQTPTTKGPYQKNVTRGINWLIKHQQPNGDLSAGGHQMYAHGLATIALCEAYGMTKETRIGYAAQSAIKFIESGQNSEGGWRYQHGTSEGDTSVFGWQIMSLRSGQMAGLQVDADRFSRCELWLKHVSTGRYNGLYSYIPGPPPKPSMTAVGLLANEYLGAGPTNAAVQESVEFILKNPPTTEIQDAYYWYYATLALHNIPGSQWDEWNRKMRRLLIATQVKSGCAEGSWNPEDDLWGQYGGRLMVTSLSALTLEVYYRYLPLYQLDEQPEPTVAGSDSPSDSDQEPN